MVFKLAKKHSLRIGKGALLQNYRFRNYVCRGGSKGGPGGYAPK